MAETPIKLDLERAKCHGLKVICTPEKGNIILKIAGKPMENGWRELKSEPTRVK